MDMELPSHQTPQKGPSQISKSSKPVLSVQQTIAAPLPQLVISSSLLAALATASSRLLIDTLSATIHNYPQFMLFINPILSTLSPSIAASPELLRHILNTACLQDAEVTTFIE